jgi:hypothetical protein
MIAWLSNSKDDMITSKTTDAGLIHEISIQEKPGIVILKNPSEDERRQVFQKFFSTLPHLPYKLYGARKQLLSAKLQTYKPIKSDTATSSSSNKDVNIEKIEIPEKDKSRSLRSGGVNNKINSVAKDDKVVVPIVMTQDGDKQCVRELRNFLRAALGERCMYMDMYVYLCTYTSIHLYVCI